MEDRVKPTHPAEACCRGSERESSEKGMAGTWEEQQLGRSNSSAWIEEVDHGHMANELT